MGAALVLRTIALMSVGGLLLSCSNEKAVSDGDEEAPFEITLQPDWYPQPEQGGFFAAFAEGMYSKSGLDVTILDAAPSLPFLQKVAKGDAMVGITRLDILAQAVEKGLPLVVIGKYAEHAPSGIMVPTNSDIEGFADLNGKRIMATIFAPYIQYLQTYYEIDMDLIPHNWGMAQFISGELDAQQCYITSEPYHVERSGLAVRTLVVADAGYDPPHVMYTNQETLSAHKAELLAFFRASMEGWKYYLNDDPSGAHAAIIERNPKMDPDFMTWSREVIREEGLVWGRPPKQRSHWGQLSESEVKGLVEQLLSIGALQELDPGDSSWIDFDFQWTESIAE